jgi:hypothetical protein
MLTFFSFSGEKQRSSQNSNETLSNNESFQSLDEKLEGVLFFFYQET